MGSSAKWPVIDLWAPVPFDELPAELVRAVVNEDWPQAKEFLGGVMDAVTTDGVYGRALLQLVMRLPLGVYPVFDRYRASVAIDHGNWDELRRCLASNVIEPAEPLGVRDVILAPLDRVVPPPATEEHHRVLHEVYEFQFQRAEGKMRRWGKRIVNFQPEFIWSREDIPSGRHARYRRLQDAMALAWGEALSGSLPTAIALAQEAQRLGDEGEPYRVVAHDLEGLARIAAGENHTHEIQFLRAIARPTGSSPLGAWEMVAYLIPFISLTSDGALEYAAQLIETIAARFGSPRGQLQGETWRVAAALLSSEKPNRSELPGLLAKARRAGPGLRATPLLLEGIATHRLQSFVESETASRRVANVWNQVSSLAWIMALNPSPATGRWLHRLLELTGWRRPVLVPPHVAADAALGLAGTGFRGASILELARAGGRVNVIVEVALQHLEDAKAPRDSQFAAISVLGGVGTVRAREILGRTSRRPDQLGVAARRALAGRIAAGNELSEREIEIVQLTREGLTNREIAGRLTLSPHTVARHLANARMKLGASNRAEAAAKLERVVS